MKKYIYMVALGVLTTTAMFADCPPAYIKGDADKIVSKEGWTLKVWITAKGTRSEGRVSHLYHTREEVCPVKNKTIITTPLGKLKYVDSPYRWGWHGWKSIN